MVAAETNVKNLMKSLLIMKDKVFKSWERRQHELSSIHSLKLFERDADDVCVLLQKSETFVFQVIDWIHAMMKDINGRMGDIGKNEQETLDRLKDFDLMISSAKVSNFFFLL